MTPPEVRITEIAKGKRIIITTSKGVIVINATTSEVLLHTEYMDELGLTVLLAGKTVYAEDNGVEFRWIDFKNSGEN